MRVAEYHAGLLDQPSDGLALGQAFSALKAFRPSKSVCVVDSFSPPAPIPVLSPHLYDRTAITTFRRTVYYKMTTETQQDMTNSRRRLLFTRQRHAHAPTPRTQNNILQHMCILRSEKPSVHGMM